MAMSRQVDDADEEQGQPSPPKDPPLFQGPALAEAKSLLRLVVLLPQQIGRKI